MKFERAIFHVGPHKTGSTAIQTACDQNRERLSDFGVLYPNGRWHPEIGSYFSENPLAFVYNILAGSTDADIVRARDRAFFDELQSQIASSQAHTLVLSYEGFVALDMNTLRNIRIFLDSVAKSVSVLVYCRAPLEFACSEISQRVKAGLPDALEVERDPPILRYKDYASRFVGTFGKESVFFRKFSRAEMPKGNVVYDFLGFAGISMENAQSLVLNSTNENSSLSAESCAVGVEMSRVYGASGATDFEQAFSPILSRIAGTRLTLSARAANMVLTQAKEHLDFVASEYGIVFSNEDHLICETPFQWSSSTLASLATQFCELLTSRRQIEQAHRNSTASLRKAERQEFVLPEISVERVCALPSCQISRGDLVSLEVDFSLLESIEHLEMGFHIRDSKYEWVFGTNSSLLNRVFGKVRVGKYRAAHHLLADFPEGTYEVGISFAERRDSETRELAWLNVVCKIEVRPEIDSRSMGYAKVPAEITLSRLST